MARLIAHLPPRPAARARAVDAGTLYRVALASRDDATVKASVNLGVSPVAVALVASARWKRPLSEERDSRVAQHQGEARVVQALRGHITRVLVEELRQDLGDLPGVKTSRKRRRSASRTRSR